MTDALGRAVLLTLCGCAASMSNLAADGDYRGATCAYSASDMGALEEHLEPALALQMHLHVLDPAGAEVLFDRAVPSVFHERAAIIRLHYASQTVPIDYFDLVPSAYVGGHYVDVAPDRNELAALMGEELPEPRRQRRRFRGNGLAFLLGFLARPLRAMAGNPLIPLRSGRTVTSYRPPTDEEIARAAPATQRVHQQLELGCGSTGVHCEQFFVLPRSDEAIRLVFARRIATLSDDPTRSFACSAIRNLVVELPAGGTLEERFGAQFGSGLQPADDVTTHGGAY